MQNSTRVVLALTVLALSGCPRKVAELGSISITPETGRPAEVTVCPTLRGLGVLMPQ